ncbi:B-cell receptor CD22-like isoform X2 [Entelurus aequoreus]|uniref:B-cell receptor CD22-like isoform X2 n=1 Tax=Entelurus aequoreus TaxID=161455 RepID=UPI002B1D156C|nr:B-cell receptor CD22-like isoform X2 [Entelurus aequoreus]
MSLKTGFVVLLLCMPGLLSAEWGGTYTEKEICAIKGSTVKLQCSFKFPPTEDGREIKVKETFWFNKDSNEDLRLDPQYFGRIQSECHGNICSLTIADVRRSDEYTFRFTTNHSRGDFIVTPGVKVTVTDLKVQVPSSPNVIGKTHWYDLKCVSTTCSPWSSSSYVWYKNGEEIQNEKSQVYTVKHEYKGSYSCAVRGHEQAASPPKCVVYMSCNKVVYSKRHICAIQGSSVDIKCEYTSYEYTQTQFWYRTDSSHWRNPSMTEDLWSDPQYEGRVELPSETSGKSTLTIKDVSQNDSAEYRFKFTTYEGFEWRSILPGSTLTVAAVQVQVMSVTVEDSHLVAQMLCHTSCLPEAPLSFVWRKNGKYITNGTKVEVTLSPGDYITCTAQQHQHISISPHLYVLKRPSVSLSHTGDILEGRPLTLTCYIDVPATVDYCWYKKKKNVSSDDEVLRKGRQLVFKSIKSSDSAEYWCTVENQLGKKTSEPVFIDVQYPPRSSSMSVHEGQFGTLTCSSDANPAASYTWYKENMSSPLASGQTLTIKDISPGQTLTIKDISPAQRLTIRNITEHGGHDYYCEANNSRGRHIIGVHVSVNGMSCRTINIIRLLCSAVVFVGILIILTLHFRTTTSPSSTADPNELVQTAELDHGVYENIQAEDAL